MHALRLVLVTALLGALSLRLGYQAVWALKTGTIRYSRGYICRRSRNPVLFWALIGLFTVLVALFCWVWFDIVFSRTPAGR